MKPLLQTIKEWLLALFWAVTLILLLKTFVAFPFGVLGTSMNNTLLTGDFILVNKLAYGPRLPITPLSIPFSHQHIPFSISRKSYLDWIQLPYFRFPGIAKIERGDIVSFNYPLANQPIDHKTQFVKRCVALSGDTFQIKTGRIFVNGKKQPTPEAGSCDYLIKTQSDKLNWKILNELGITEGGRIEEKNTWQITLSNTQLEAIRKLDFVLHVERIISVTQDEQNHVFPYNDKFPWTIDNFGSVVIPKKGMTIKLTPENLILYQNVISRFEKKQLDVIDSLILIDEQAVDSYTFELDYYFMMGDNWNNSSDSRFWGFVPESHVIGKVSFVLFSIDKSADSFWKRVRWRRIGLTF